jgi:3-oxoacyl-[acyl-carrier-protein] synthase-1
MTIYLNALGMICPLGHTQEQIRQHLLDGVSGLQADARFHNHQASALTVGKISLSDSELASDAHLPLPLRSRNNRLALSALAQIRPQVDALIERYGSHRIGVLIGTSTSGISQTENALRHQLTHGALPDDFHYGQQELGSPATALALTLGLSGPAYVHSSACSSSAKAMASAARLIRMGLCDAVIAGGVDTLCQFTVAGFTALESVSPQRCNPLSINRCGINIGEGAALFIMSSDAATVALAGAGESSDAHHISAPDPSGSGAALAINQALQRAGLAAHQIDYINLHGTATPQNDAMESQVIQSIFGQNGRTTTPVSSTKPLTGHTLGAASAIEAGLCWLSMQDDNHQGLLPPHLWDGASDPSLPPLPLVQAGQALGRPPRYVLSNSFAFGGSNAALIFARA